jgi:predicted transcriptional regulator
MNYFDIYKVENILTKSKKPCTVKNIFDNCNLRMNDVNSVLRYLLSINVIVRIERKDKNDFVRYMIK